MKKIDVPTILEVTMVAVRASVREDPRVIALVGELVDGHKHLIEWGYEVDAVLVREVAAVVVLDPHIVWTVVVEEVQMLRLVRVVVMHPPL